MAEEVPNVTFPSNQPSGPEETPVVAPWAKRLVETVFLRADEIEQTAQRLREEISLREQRSDYGSVIASLDRAEENTRLAFQLSVTLKAERDSYENSAKVVEGDMRDQAVARLNEDRAKDKADNGKSKAITEADVELKIAKLFHDEWESLANERRRLELAVRYYDHQVEIWASRCRSLQVLATKMR
jgi:hypothetical protein